MPKGNDTVKFIRFGDIPKDRISDVTYLRKVVADRPQKANPKRVRWTAGGDRINYPYEVATTPADLTTAKIVINSTISTPGATFCCFDIKDFYLHKENKLRRPEYIRVHIKLFPQAIIDQYNLTDLADSNGNIYMLVTGGMYGLPQAGFIANSVLVPYLATHGYRQSKHTPGLFMHDKLPIQFALKVDDFGIKSVGDAPRQHLLKVLSAKYNVTVDMTGSTFCGLHLDWDYVNRHVDLSMPGYIERALKRFAHPLPSKPEDSPHAWSKPIYGATTQLTAAPDTSAPLPPDGIRRIQEIIGVLLFFSRAVDNTIVPALNEIGAAQSKSTEHTAEIRGQTAQLHGLPP